MVDVRSEDAAARPSASSRSDGLSFGLFGSYFLGATVTDIEFRRDHSNDAAGRLHILFSGGRELVIPRPTPGNPMKVETPASADWLAPALLAFPNSERMTLGDAAATFYRLDRLHQIIMAIDANRLDALRTALAHDRKADLRALFKPDDLLELTSFGSGSWFSELKAKTKLAYRAAITIAMTTTEWGRGHVKRRAEADTTIRELEVDAKRIALENARIGNRKAEAAAAKAEIEVEAARVRLAKERTKVMSDQFALYKSLNDYREKKILKLPANDRVRLEFDDNFTGVTAAIEGRPVKPLEVK